MKQIFTSIALIAMAISFASCDKEIIVECNCNCNCSNSDNTNQNGGRPGNDNNGGSNEDNPGGGNTNTIDRSEYQVYNNTFTQGQAGFCGVYYDEQPSNTTNWYVELADNNYDLESYEGTGFNIVLEFFAGGTNSTSIPAGTYTIEAFEAEQFSAGSLLYAFLDEGEDNGETVQYPAGTWLFEGNEAIAGATAGWVKVAQSGGNYTITYELHDDEYSITFKGSYSGSLTIYDGTQENSAIAAAPQSKAPRKTNTKYYRVRR